MATAKGKVVTAKGFQLRWKIPNYVEGRKPKPGKPRIVWATPEEAAKLIQVARENRQAPHLLDFIELGLNTGMRKMEMLACELSRIDLRNEVIHLDPDDQKNGQYDTIPLNRMAKKVILRRLSFIKEYCPDTPGCFRWWKKEKWEKNTSGISKHRSPPRVIRRASPTSSHMRCVILFAVGYCRLACPFIW